MGEVLRDPLSRIGKPERLRYKLSGACSRRLTSEQRLVYAVTEVTAVCLQVRFPYQYADPYFASSTSLGCKSSLTEPLVSSLSNDSSWYRALIHSLSWSQ